MAKKEGLTERRELRLTPTEQEVIQKAAELKNLTVSEFMRFVAVEMARAIVAETSPEETYYAVIMSAGRFMPEVVAYSATTDLLEIPKKEQKGFQEYSVVSEEEMKDAED